MEVREGSNHSQLATFMTSRRILISIHNMNILMASSKSRQPLIARNQKLDT